MCYETARPIMCILCGRTYHTQHAPDLCSNVPFARRVPSGIGSCGTITRPRELPSLREGRCPGCVRSFEISIADDMALSGDGMRFPSAPPPPTLGSEEEDSQGLGKASKDDEIEVEVMEVPKEKEIRGSPRRERKRKDVGLGDEVF